jgi:hypothetical protein
MMTLMMIIIIMIELVRARVRVSCVRCVREGSTANWPWVRKSRA